MVFKPHASQVLSTFFFNVDSPVSNTFRLSASQSTMPFLNHMFEQVMLKRENAEEKDYSYTIYDTPDLLLLRSGLMVRASESLDRTNLVFSVYKLDADDIYKPLTLVDQFNSPITSRLDLHKKLFFDAYGVPQLTHILTPKYPVMNKGDKIFDVKPMLKFSARILDNTYTVNEANYFPDSVPIQLRHYEFEMLAQQDLFNSIRNTAGFTLFENPYLTKFQPYDNPYDYIVPLEREMKPEISDESDWKDFLPDTFIVRNNKFSKDERYSVERSTYFNNMFYYRSPADRPDKFSYYVVNISAKRGNLFENFNNLVLNLETPLYYVPEPEHVHILNFLHLYNPALDYAEDVGMRALGPKAIFTMYDLRDRILTILEQYYQHQLLATFSPNDYTKTMAWEAQQLILYTVDTLDHIFSYKSPEVLKAMAWDYIRQKVYSLLETIGEAWENCEKGNKKIAMRKLLVAPQINAIIIFLRFLYLERFGNNIEHLSASRPLRND
ncbi:hypothetical protein [Psittacicella hinzii]|uniref:Uncharacterized protein n=1 Tax=Psittacicella hinzii TaxID=2028575 RepID=A0A3A1YI01_9GAMM|nr:hypothetical protein [Psittacicella hinzii]RIY37076.1 hypothetical protein CKF58_05475 [Psittacicella hinzii]